MSRIKQLESKRLIKELEYIQSDFNYRSELISEADSEFLKNLNSYLDAHPKIKEIFDIKINNKIQSIFDKRQKEILDNINSESEKKDVSDEDLVDEVVVSPRKLKLKKLYRTIVKFTHPDLISNSKLNELYIKATKFYDEDNFAGIYSICDELDIEFEIEDDEIQQINDRITNLKSRIQFMETTLTWKWFNSDENNKEKILFEYLKLRLNN